MCQILYIHFYCYFVLLAAHKDETFSPSNNADEKTVEFGETAYQIRAHR